MTKEELAGLLNGRQYGEEITTSESLSAKQAGLVVIYGYSDDNVELRGMIHDEVGAYNGRTLYLHRDGMVVEPDECSECKARAEAEKRKCAVIKCDWDSNGYSWFISPITELGIPYASFDIFDDLEKFCRGIVINTKDLPSLTQPKRDIKFVKRDGLLADALGVSAKQIAVIDEYMNRHIELNTPMIAVLEGLHAMNLSDAEWTSAIYALGIYQGRRGA